MREVRGPVPAVLHSAQYAGYFGNFSQNFFSQIVNMYITGIQKRL